MKVSVSRCSLLLQYCELSFGISVCFDKKNDNLRVKSDFFCKICKTYSKDLDEANKKEILKIDDIQLATKFDSGVYLVILAIFSQYFM
jgi:hypothetical protein